MNSYKKDSKELLRRYEQGTCSEEEKLWIESRYNEVANRGLDHSRDIDPTEVKDEVWAQIKKQTILKRQKVRKLTTIAAAASVLVFFGLIGWNILIKDSHIAQEDYTMATPSMKIEEVRVSKAEVAERRDESVSEKAVPHIVLSDGKVIPLVDFSNGLRVQEDGIYYIQGKQIEFSNQRASMHTLTTPKGYDCKFTLSDGTIVWLNAESSIRFPLVFGTSNREVELEGEAYFDVFHDAGHPFIVKSKNQSIKVLGTQFNVRAYPREQTVKTTLIEGSVDVLTGKEQARLSPGQQLTLYEDKLSVSEKFDMESVIAWKHGYFRFNGNLEEIMTDLARWYDLDLDYRVPANYEIDLEAALSKSKTIQEMMELIQSATGLKLTIKERRLSIMK
ncbi:FecR family protein [Sphingobacterium tabacisoli]|uniref:FecR family protein n=1 Tax=Sphingobacterium tabacisoli TaxID=2044855 RepID=A0ABW5L4S8_9SPHI|nr:FecR family protein [Sphingobacterium tabacisoli]